MEFKSIYTNPNNTTYRKFTLNVINTKMSNNLILPLCRTVHAQRSVSVRGVREWNSLPQEIKSITSVNLFKSKIKHLLLHSYEYWPLTDHTLRNSMIDIHISLYACMCLHLPVYMCVCVCVYVWVCEFRRVFM